MKAKHVAARIKGLSVWQKIFCTLIAASLLLLMVPSGLRANAETQPVAEQNGDVSSSLQQEEVNKDSVKKMTEDETLDAFKDAAADAEAAPVTEAGWWTLNSDVTFVPSSYNATETAGHFVTQKAQVPITSLFEYMGTAFPLTEDEFSADLAEMNSTSMHTWSGWLKGLLNVIETEETVGNVFEDLSEALIIPDWSSANKATTDMFNTFVFGVNNIWKNPFVDTDDGSILYLYVTLGEGDNFVDVVKNTMVHATRVLPIIPALNPGHFSDSNGLLGDSLNAANTQAYFMNWSISLDGTNYIPLTWVLDMVSDNTLSILPYTHYYFKANFWDVEGLVPVHLDFNGAYVAPALQTALRLDGWYTLDLVNGSVWTKAYFDWMPTWYVYSDVFTKFGSLIFGDIENKVPPAVYKDQWMVESFVSGGHPYPGPNWFEFDNENYFGTLDKESTFSFSVYPVSPRGHVIHNTPAGIFDYTTDYAPNAYVMYYNEYGWPLFSFDEAKYSTGSEPLYSFWDQSGVPAYCYDTQIDHATVYAYSNSLFGYSYLPLWADMSNYDAMSVGLLDEGLVDFQVERIMYSDVNTFMQGDAIDNIQVNYFQDGKQLFDTYTITDPWQMRMLSMPMVSNGTLTTWRNTIVSGFDSNIDFVNPFESVDMLNAFNTDNFEASGTNHLYQCQIIVNVKAGYTFNNWTYDYLPLNTTDDNPVYVEEPIFFPSHVIGMNIAKPVAAVNDDNAAIYGDADNAAIYGEAAATATAGKVVLASDGAATSSNTTSGTAQTGDSMGFALAILAMIALAGAGVLAGRKLYTK